MKAPSVGVVFVTHCAKRHLPKCLPPILKSPLSPKVLVMNSSSHDGTVECARELGADTFVIPRKEFNHGASREKARQRLGGCDIVVMMTPDAYAVHCDMLTHLVSPIASGEASLSYARQIPHDEAGIFEKIPREFNYPPESHVRSFADREAYGVYTIFCSNSCAAYLNSALDEVGGFAPALIGEDTFTAAKLLRKGHKIAYAADAVVKHSHTYGLRQEFQRHFDTALARSWNRELFEDLAADEERGREFFMYLLKRLAQRSPHLIPYGLIQTGVKYLGYRLGKISGPAPLWVKKLCSSQDFYWNQYSRYVTRD